MSFFFCVDGLPGFKEAIQAVYPQAEIQRCVIHMLRNSFKYVNYNDLKKVFLRFQRSVQCSERNSRFNRAGEHERKNGEEISVRDQ